MFYDSRSLFAANAEIQYTLDQASSDLNVNRGRSELHKKWNHAAYKFSGSSGLMIELFSVHLEQSNERSLEISDVDDIDAGSAQELNERLGKLILDRH